MKEVVFFFKIFDDNKKTEVVFVFILKNKNKKI